MRSYMESKLSTIFLKRLDLFTRCITKLTSFKLLFQLFMFMLDGSFIFICCLQVILELYDEFTGSFVFNEKVLTIWKSEK